MISQGWQLPTLQITGCSVVGISLMVPESSLVRDWCHICWAMPTISSKVILLGAQCSSASFCLLRALMIRQRAPPHLNLSALSSQCWCDQTFPKVVALAMSSLTFFWRQTLTYLGGQGRCGMNLALIAPQVNDFDLIGDFDLIRCHGRGFWVRWVQIWDDGRQLHYCLLRTKGQQARELCKPAVLQSYCISTVDFPLVGIIRS